VLGVALAALCAAALAPVADPREARAADDAPLALEWRMAKGASLRYRYTSAQTTEQRQDGPSAETVTTSQREEIEYRLTAIEEDPRTGGARVICRYDQVAIDLEQLMLGRVRWDSRKKEDLARGEEPAVRPYAKLVGQEFGFLLGRGGHVSEMRGHDRVRAALLQGLEDSPFAKLALGGAFGDEAVRSALERAFAVVPTTTARKGDRFTSRREQPVPILGTLAYDTESVVAGVKDGIAEVTFTTRISRARPPVAAEDALAAKVDAELISGVGEGRALFSTRDARLERSEATVRMTVATRLLPPAAPKEGAGAVAVRSDVTQRITVERIAE